MHSKAFVPCPLVHSFFIILKAFIICVRNSDNCFTWSSHMSFSSSTIPRNLVYGPIYVSLGLNELTINL